MFLSYRKYFRLLHATKKTKEGEQAMETTRRGFLTAMGATGAALALGMAGCASQKNMAATGDKAAETPEVDLSNATVVECDMAVVGTGTSGLIAATRAAELGARVVVLEKLSEIAVGGCSRYTAGFAAFNAKDLKGVEGTMTPDEYIGIQTEYHRNACNIDAVRLYAYNSGEATDWLTEQGVQFNVFGNVHQPVAPEVTDAGLTGPGMIDVLYTQAKNYDVDFRFETVAKGLITDGDTVNGVYAETDSGELLAIQAPKVVLATGGFGANGELFEKHTGVSYDVVEFYGPDGVPMGDGIEWALGLGASQHHPNAVSYANLKLADFPGEGAPENILFAKQQPLVWVNSRARRFVTEDLCTVADWTLNGESVSQQEKVFSIFDQAFLDRIATEGPWQGQLFTEIEEGKAIPEATDYANAVIDSGTYECYKADTLAELAEKAGLDASTLEETIAEYNEFCKAGVDGHFNKNKDHLVAVTTPPYYCFRNKLAFYNTLGGLKVDDSCQVLKMKGSQPITGLYAVGSDAGGAFGYYYNSSVTPGEMQGWCVTTGYVVGNSVA